MFAWGGLLKHTFMNSAIKCAVDKKNLLSGDLGIKRLTLDSIELEII